MVLWIADRYPKAALAPAPRSRLRPEFLRRLAFKAAAMYPAFLRFYYPDRYSTQAGSADGISSAAVAELQSHWNVLAQALGSKPWLLGKKFSAVDIYSAMLVTWNADLPAFRALHPNLWHLAERVRARPRIAPIWTANGMPED
jgi:glutathione S-transferase